jgi:predicted dehydrogenase
VNSPPRWADHRLSRRESALSSQAAISNKQEISVLLVGAGRRGLNAHVPALRAIKPMRLAAIVETPQRIAELQATPELAVPLYDSIDSALAAETLHLAIVATPHDSHVPLTIRLLKGHIPTLLEKPPARNCHEFAELMQASDDNHTPLNAILTLHYQSRFKDFIRTLRSPTLTDAKVFVAADVPSWPGAGHWRQSRERAGGGVLIDLGYHYLELLVTCLGVPQSFAVQLRTNSPTDDVEDQAHASLYFGARRITVDISLQSGSELARRSELLIVADQKPIFAISSSEQAAWEHNHPSPPPKPSAAIAQLTSLVGTGFLAGGGSWRKTLARQIKVLSLLDQMYADAEYRSEISERVLV